VQRDSVIGRLPLQRFAVDAGGGRIIADSPASTLLHLVVRPDFAQNCNSPVGLDCHCPDGRFGLPRRRSLLSLCRSRRPSLPTGRFSVRPTTTRCRVLWASRHRRPGIDSSRGGFSARQVSRAPLLRFGSPSAHAAASRCPALPTTGRSRSGVSRRPTARPFF